MNDFLSALLQAVIVAAVPVCAAFISKGLQAFAQYIAAKTSSELARKYLNEAVDAISTAVAHTSQTYVDGLKKSSCFTKENQEEALRRSLEKAESLLTAEAQAFLKNAYGDLNAYLISRIEAEVRSQKLTVSSQ